MRPATPESGSRAGPAPRVLFLLPGLAVVVVALAWAESHPARPMLDLIGAQVFRCGPIEPGTFGRHAWVIRNAGTAPLRLRTWFTSGRTGFSLWQGREHALEPGSRITVHLTWRTPGRESEPYASYAILRTDDPERPEIRLSVVGTTRRIP